MINNHAAHGDHAPKPAASCEHHCAVPTNDNNPDAPPVKGLRGFLKKAFAAVGGGAGGLLAGHAGCLVAPVLLATAGITTATAGLSVLAIAFSAAATAGGLYAWKHMRGYQAGKWEKRLVIGGAIAGLSMSAAMNLGGFHQHHHQSHAPELPAAVICGPGANTTPATERPPAQPAHNHHNHKPKM
jgi:hypothetical protein